jgi:hypothetical protein
VCLVTLAVSQPAQASGITFDSTITTGSLAVLDPVGSPVFLDTYLTPSQPAANADTFKTQGFTFGGYTPPVTGTTRTSPELDIMLDPSQCSAQSPPGVTCASDGSHYLVSTDIFSLFPDAPLNFSISGFDASGLFGPAGCTLCDNQGTIFPAPFIQVIGVRNGLTVVADETFALTFAFQTFTLSDPDWANVGKVIFRPVDASGNTIGQIMALDNIRATSPVPEPATVGLMGMGLLGLVLARKRRR